MVSLSFTQVTNPSQKFAVFNLYFRNKAVCKSDFNFTIYKKFRMKWNETAKPLITWMYSLWISSLASSEIDTFACVTNRVHGMCWVGVCALARDRACLIEMPEYIPFLILFESICSPTKSLETIGRPRCQSECKQKYLSKVPQQVFTYFAFKPLRNFTQM